VAQQVRALEGHVGVALAYREGRGIALTAEGRALSAGLSDGFGRIADAVAQISASRSGQPLRVSLTPSFANQWLMPRLGRFWKAHPEVPLTLLPDPRVVDLTRDRIDLAIRFGRGTWPGVDATLLTPAAFTIVGAPSLLGDAQDFSMAQLQAMPWVIAQDWPEQFAWLRSIGIDPDTLRATTVPTEELALIAARQGYGLHIELTALLEDDIRQDRFRIVYQDEASDVGYYLVTRPGPARPELRLFLRWIKSVV
jgi:LysR family glycine cleavage system transcriptional activator